MPNKIKVDFYRVTVPEHSIPFENIILADAASADDETRNIPINGRPVRLQEATRNRGLIEGDMLRIQMSDLPPKASLSGEVDNLNFEDDEGLGGETAFVYHPGTKVLAIQRNRSGVSARAFVDYFTQKAALPVGISLEPVIAGDAIVRLARMKETRRFKVRLAGVTNPAFFKQQDKGLGEMVDVLNYFRAPAATIELSMGHAPGGLTLERVVDLASKVVNLDSDGKGEVVTMEISGVLDNDDRDEFDILQYRMIEVVTVDENKHRRSSYKKRHPEIRQAWEKRRAELEKMYAG